MTVLDSGDADLKHHQNERSVLLVTGGGSSFAERDGTTYGVQPRDPAATDYLEDGAALPDCASPTARGCVDRSGPRVVVRMKDGGFLQVPGAQLSIDGPVARTIDVEVVAPMLTFSP